MQIYAKKEVKKSKRRTKQSFSERKLHSLMLSINYLDFK